MKKCKESLTGKHKWSKEYEDQVAVDSGEDRIYYVTFYSQCSFCNIVNDSSVLKKDMVLRPGYNRSGDMGGFL